MEPSFMEQASACGHALFLSPMQGPVARSLHGASTLHGCTYHAAGLPVPDVIIQTRPKREWDERDRGEKREYVQGRA
jgi:hypothetical protein